MKIPENLRKRLKITPNKTFEAAPPNIELMPVAEVCEDCCDVVVDRQITYRKVIQPMPHWNIQCTVCKNYKDPESGEFNLNQQELRNYWLEKKKTK